MRRNLPADRSQQHPGDPAATPATDDDRVGIVAALTQHGSGLPEYQQRTHFPGAHEVAGAPRPVGEDPFTVLPILGAHSTVAGQRREARSPGMTYRERDSA